jgi:hypothetical protein
MGKKSNPTPLLASSADPAKQLGAAYPAFRRALMSSNPATGISWSKLRQTLRFLTRKIFHTLIEFLEKQRFVTFHVEAQIVRRMTDLPAKAWPPFLAAVATP